MLTPPPFLSQPNPTKHTRSAGRIGFSTPDRVFWNSMAEALSAHFDRRTGRALSSQDLNYLR